MRVAATQDPDWFVLQDTGPLAEADDGTGWSLHFVTDSSGDPGSVLVSGRMPLLAARWLDVVDIRLERGDPAEPRRQRRIEVQGSGWSDALVARARAPAGGGSDEESGAQPDPGARDAEVRTHPSALIRLEEAGGGRPGLRRELRNNASGSASAPLATTPITEHEFRVTRISCYHHGLLSDR